jgi:hypothetical protein
VARYRQFSAPRERFPWLILLALFAAIYLFFIMPRQVGPRPVNVEFSRAESR